MFFTVRARKRNVTQQLLLLLFKKKNTVLMRQTKKPKEEKSLLLTTSGFRRQDGGGREECVFLVCGWHNVPIQQIVEHQALSIHSANDYIDSSFVGAARITRISYLPRSSIGFWVSILPIPQATRRVCTHTPVSKIWIVGADFLLKRMFSTGSKTKQTMNNFLIVT